MEKPKLKTCAERTEATQEPIAQPFTVIAMQSEIEGAQIIAHTRIRHADGREQWVKSYLTPDQFWLEQELYRRYVGKEMN